MNGDKEEMNKVYLDVTKRENCPAICVAVKDMEVIISGSTVYHIDSNNKNETYQQYAKEYDIHFIFDDDIIELSFYTVPQVDVFATDSKECFLIANSGKEFLETIKSWKNNLKPYNGVIFYESKLEAKKELKFINI